MPDANIFLRLEPYAGKLARTVLRGVGGGNVTHLPADFVDVGAQCQKCQKVGGRPRRGAFGTFGTPSLGAVKNRTAQTNCVYGRDWFR